MRALSGRRRLTLWLLAIPVFSFTSICANAQDQMHPEPPEYPFTALAQQGTSRSFNERLEPHWFKSQPHLSQPDQFWYRRDQSDGRRRFIVVDPESSAKLDAFDHGRFTAALSAELKREFSSDKLPFESIAIVPPLVHVIVNDEGWVFDPLENSLAKNEKSVEIVKEANRPANSTSNTAQRFRGRDQSSRRGDRSPDGKWVAIIKDHNVYLRKTTDDRELKLTTNGSETDFYETGAYWSPDSKRFVVLKTAKEQEHTVYFVQSSPKTQVQPRLQKHQYLKPGDQIALTKPHIFCAETKEETAIKDELFPNPWSLDQIRWTSDSSRFTFLYNQRGHQVLRLVSVDAATGTPTALIDEKSATFIDYSNKTFCRFLEKTGDILWMSERSGWNHLYRIDGKTGEVKNPVTSGEWIVRGVDRVDEEEGTINLRIAGYHKDQDPYHIHFARVNLDGSGLTLLTEGDGTHSVQLAPNRGFLIDTYSRVDLPPVHELRNARTGKLVLDLEKADVATSGLPERFVAKGRDGKTDIYGFIVRPKGFDPKKKYPVIEQIYAGPHGAHVSKAYGGGRNLQGLADLGFIMVEIDGMGTNWRSKAFHDVCWKNIKDAGFPDRIAWMKAAAQKYPEIDLSRVGIYGGSAGGQNAMAALLFHGDFYKIAAADCGCHDNRMDKIWWNEAWMGWPIDKSYEESSNVVNAAKLQGKLLLTVGETDHNVDPASTMQVVDALIRANKDFELIVFPGADHGAGGSAYGRRRMREFFVRHLQTAEVSASGSQAVGAGAHD